MADTRSALRWADSSRYTACRSLATAEPSSQLVLSTWPGFHSVSRASGLRRFRASCSWSRRGGRLSSP